MSNLSMFMKKNKVEKVNTKYAATESLLDAEGKPLEWEIKSVNTKQHEELRESCTMEVQVTGKPGVFRQKLNSSKYVAKLLAASVVFPDLHDKELQDSYGVMTAEDLIQEILDDPKEYNELAEFVQNFNGFEPMEAKVEEAKN